MLVSANYTLEGLYPDLLEFMEIMTPEMFAGTPMETEYARLAPNPENFTALVEKVAQLDVEMQDLSAESIEAITAPTLVIAGDSDAV